MYITISQLVEMGVMPQEIEAKISGGDWKTARPDPIEDGERRILLSSLPLELQTKWARANRISSSSPEILGLLAEAENFGLADRETRITELLSLLAADERAAWLAEAVRLAKLLDRYDRTIPKRRRNATTRKLEFTAAVVNLCQEAVCHQPLILRRQPHRAEVPSPHTLERWLRDYRREGLLTFLHSITKREPEGKDKRCAEVSPGAVTWINGNWRRFHGPRFLYRALEEEARKQNWRIPSESWLYRLWRQMPEIVKTSHRHGKGAYESKYAPYVPRDYSDLEALQVLCGDHSERDVTVLLPDNTLARPWLTLWLDLRTWLIWGWSLELIPSSVSAGLAYADGVQNFGAQPPCRAEDGYFSYVYTDRGRDYRSHHWDGKVIKVHKTAMNIDGALEFLLTEREVGILSDLQLRHLLARGRNPKEKPIERLFKDISDWERNSFKEYCGRNAAERPEAWRKLYARHQQFVKGQLSASPFMTIDAYRESLAQFITRHNTTPHERPSLRSERLVPMDEFRRLYSVKYEIKPETLALLLLKPDHRIIRKGGVQCFQKHWFYFHERMSGFKGLSVEIRYSDDDYSKIWVVLPKGGPCEASLTTPTSLLKPNRKTLETVATARAHEKKIIRDYQLIQQSAIRGEETEDRVAQLVNRPEDLPNASDAPARVHLLNRLDHRHLRIAPDSRTITAADVAATQVILAL
jgi:Mu transposase, C-terminal/Mu DNA binding, I gamma subdomain